MAGYNYYSLFQITDDGKCTKLEKEELVNPLVRAVYNRDKDKNKTNALKELTYVYYIADSKSACRRRGESGKQLHISAAQMAGLKTTYKPDVVIEELIKDYEANNGGPYVRSLQTSLKSLVNIDRSLSIINERINAQMEIMESIYADDKVHDDQGNNRLKLSIDEVLALGKQAADLAMNLPKYRKTLSETLVAVLEEEEEQIAYGGIVIEDSMQPDKVLSALQEYGGKQTG